MNQLIENASKIACFESSTFVWVPNTSQANTAQQFTTGQLSNIVFKMLWNILTVVQFTAGDNNNSIHMNKGWDLNFSLKITRQNKTCTSYLFSKII